MPFRCIFLSSKEVTRHQRLVFPHATGVIRRRLERERTLVTGAPLLPSLALGNFLLACRGDGLHGWLHGGVRFTTAIKNRLGTVWESSLHWTLATERSAARSSGADLPADRNSHLGAEA